MRPQAPPPELSIDVGAMRRRHETHAAIHTALQPAWLREALAPTDATVSAPIDVHVAITLQADGSAIVTGTLRGGFEVPCARCLDPAAVDATGPITALFVREGAARRLPEERDDDGPGDDEDGDEDLWPFDGMTLDLSALLTETIRLAYPMRALCPRGEQCRGLCSHCGAPLNDQPPQPVCVQCGAVDPRVPLVDEVPAAPGTQPGALAEALKKVRDS
ncbi:MAG: DUF177 domain-containing protein [Nannocystaceae bacterium]|nr:DUF177 domain-containing protein [Nannocystaceae bacterium]